MARVTGSCTRFPGESPDVTKTWKVAQEVMVGGSCDRVSDHIT